MVKKIITSAVDAWKTISVIIAIGGAFIYVHNYLENNKRSVIEAVKSYSDTTKIEINNIKKAVYEQGWELMDIKEQQNYIIEQQQKQKNIITKEFAKTMTPEQVLNMMEQFEAKKNNTGIQSPGDN